MQFKAFMPGIEVSGQVVQLTLDSFKFAPSIAMKYLVRSGILEPGRAIELNGWYSQEKWLATYESIARDVGPNALIEVGRQVGGKVLLPPTLGQTVLDLLLFLDVGYHLSHRRSGVVMYDFGTQKMADGIGHYLAKPVAGKDQVTVTCENPYPCDFDLGLVRGAALRFQPKARVVHDDKVACRKQGAESCTYHVSW